MAASAAVDMVVADIVAVVASAAANMVVVDMVAADNPYADQWVGTVVDTAVAASAADIVAVVDMVVADIERQDIAMYYPSESEDFSMPSHHQQPWQRH